MSLKCIMFVISYILPSPFGCTVDLILCCSPIKVFIDKQNVQSVASL